MFEHSSFGSLMPSAIYFFLLLVLSYLLLWSQKRYRNLPPGPKPLPVFGNVLELVFGESNLMLACRKFRKQYGDIFTVYSFNQIVIFVNGYQYVKEMFVRNGRLLTRRGKHPHFFMYKGEGITFADGEIWKFNRRFLLHTLKDFGMGKSRIQTKVHEEFSHLLDAIEKHNGQPFDIRQLLQNAVSNIVCSLTFGKRFDYTDDAFKLHLSLMDDVNRNNLLIIKPTWFRYIPGDPFLVAKAHRDLEALMRFYRSKVHEHLESYDENDIRDVIDAYIKQWKECSSKDEPSLMNEEELVRIVQHLFFAGTDTTASTLGCGMLLLLGHPDIQERIYEELRDAVPVSRFPAITDKEKLPFLEATALEIQRRSVISGTGAPRSTDADIQFRGFTIPKTAIVIPNLDSVLLDESAWANPFDFNPSRFLTDNGVTLNADEFIPFSIGSRACPGQALAKAEIYLFLSAMLQRFQFLPPEGEDPPSFTKVVGQVDAPAPFKLRAIKRI